jgi:hypothetical protein
MRKNIQRKCPQTIYKSFSFNHPMHARRGSSPDAPLPNYFLDGPSYYNLSFITHRFVSNMMVLTLLVDMLKVLFHNN